MGLQKAPKPKKEQRRRAKISLLKCAFFSSPKKKSSHFLKNKNTKIIFFRIMMSLIGPPLFFPFIDTDLGLITLIFKKSCFKNILFLFNSNKPLELFKH